MSLGCPRWGCWLRDSRLGPATSLLGPSHCMIQAENDSQALPWLKPSAQPVCALENWTDLARNQGAWRQTGEMEKLKTKHSPIKQRDISQLQIVRRVHLGFCLAGSDGEAFPLQLQAMDRCPLLAPAIPTGAVELQMLGVPMHVALRVGKVFRGHISDPVMPQKLPMGVPPSPACSCLRQVVAGPAPPTQVQQFPRGLHSSCWREIFLFPPVIPFGFLYKHLHCFPQRGNIRLV